MEDKTIVAEGMGKVSQMASGFFYTVKTAIQDGAATLVAQFKAYKGNFLELLVYAGVFIIVGFLFKRTVRYIIFFALFIAGLIILEQFDLLHTTVNWAKIQHSLNIQPLEDPLTMDTAGMLIKWAKMNVAIVVTATVGFVIGLKLG